MGATKTWQFVAYIVFYLCFSTWLLWEAFSQKPSVLVFILLLLGGCAGIFLLAVQILLFITHLKKARRPQQTL